MTKELPSPSLLGVLPNRDELDRLVENYPSYKWVHRSALLNGYFQGRTLKQLVEDKLNAKGLKGNECSPHSLGGHSRWVSKKIVKTIARILYLRCRIDDGKTRIEANQHLLKMEEFASKKDASDAGQSAIRKMTQGAKIDAHISCAASL